jgi:single-strand DNA-binding protein
MSSYNRVTLMGNLTRQPELRKTKTGTPVTELGLALNRVWSGENGEKQEEVTFVDVTVWGRNAENAAQYLQKGRAVLIEGRLQLETWQDKQSGQDRTKLKVVADAIQFLGGGHDSGTQHPSNLSTPSTSEDSRDDADSASRSGSSGRRNADNRRGGAPEREDHPEESSPRRNDDRRSQRGYHAA